MLYTQSEALILFKAFKNNSKLYFYPMSVLDELNTLDLFELFTNEAKALNFAFHYDMLYDEGICESTLHCRGRYYIVRDLSTKTGYRLKCSKCKKTKSLFYNSIFTRSQLPVNVVLHILYCWAHECSIDFTSHECDVSTNTVTNFFQAFRQACKYVTDNEPHFQIGGPGRIVEIDETIISKRKSNAGRILPEIWVFGGVCRESGERFALQVPDRSASTLIPIIQRYIAPSSVIYSDSWKAYNRIAILPQRYTHKTVNHSTNFVDPVSGAHTQNVERMWREVKRVRRRYEGINRIDIDYHIAEYLWRTNNNVNRKNCFAMAVLLITECPYY